jgi:hypothetical protein
VHPPGVEPGPIAWKAIILPLDQECLMKKLKISMFIIFKIHTFQPAEHHDIEVALTQRSYGGHVNKSERGRKIWDKIRLHLTCSVPSPSPLLLNQPPCISQNLLAKQNPWPRNQSTASFVGRSSRYTFMKIRSITQLCTLSKRMPARSRHTPVYTTLQLQRKVYQRSQSTPQNSRINYTEILVTDSLIEAHARPFQPMYCRSPALMGQTRSLFPYRPWGVLRMRDWAISHQT